jgi:hypothetical protein
MLFKFLWILVVVWIAYRVFVAGRSLVRLALGRDEASLSGSDSDPARPADRPPQRPADRVRSDVEDARWVDL